VIAPAGALRTSAVSAIVRSACRRAGLPSVGSHALRHTMATEMLKQGASLPEIGEVLRHREQKTTAIYAKVDRRTLRPLARPWPEGGAS
jgi:integrase/recombinase XerD